MRYTVCIITLIKTIICNAQFNLVPNPSFENYSACPPGVQSLTMAVGWINPVSNGTPDYYNACSSSASVPYCANGTGFDCFQFAKSGVAYAGIYGFGYPVANAREYAQIQLTSPLTNGKCYYVGYYLNI